MNQKENSKTLQAFWIAIGSFFSMAVGIISAAILSRYLNKADFGTYKQVLYIYSTFLVIFSAGLPRVFSYFLPRFSLEEGKTIVSKINKILFLAGLFFSLFLFLFSGVISNILKNPDLSYALKAFSPVPMLLLPTLGIEGIFATYKKTIYIAIYNVLSKVLILIFIVAPIIIYKQDFIWAIYGWSVASVFTLIIAYLFKGIPFKKVSAIDTSLKYKEIFSYSLPLVGASIWGIAIISANEFYISRYFGAEIFAEFSNGFIELPFVTMITSSASVVLMPVFSKIFHENKGLKDLTEVWRNTLAKSAKIIYPLIIFFIVFATETMVILYSQEYEQSGVYFRINLFLNFFNIVIFGPLFFAMGKTRLYANVHMVLAFVIWSSDYFLIKMFNSPIAIALNSTFLNILKIIYFLYLASNLLKINFYYLFPVKRLFVIFSHGLIAIIIVKLLQTLFLYSLALFLQVFICSLAYALLILTTGRFFKIDYIIILRPFIRRLNLKK